MPHAREHCRSHASTQSHVPRRHATIARNRSSPNELDSASCLTGTVYPASDGFGAGPVLRPASRAASPARRPSPACSRARCCAHADASQTLLAWTHARLPCRIIAPLSMCKSQPSHTSAFCLHTTSSRPDAFSGVCASTLIENGE